MLEVFVIFCSLPQMPLSSGPLCLVLVISSTHSLSLAHTRTETHMATPTFTTIKELSEFALSSLPSQYISRKQDLNSDPVSDEEEEIPTIDFSLLKRGTPDQRSRAIQELGRACQDWGCFMVVNHGIPEAIKKAVIDTVERFFDLTPEEKREQSGKHPMDPIRFGISFNTAVEEVTYWRDYLKLAVHPVFHSPASPPDFREILQEYCSSTREMGRELLKGIWESLNLEESVTDGALGLESCFQVFAANLYPPCPQPELAMGLPPHSDHGLLTILVQNGVNGLQIKHNGRWVHIKPPSHAFLIHTGDHMEIISNGIYKSVLHRAIVNSQRTRLSIATVLGPSLDAVVVPAPQLVSSEDAPARFRGIKYRDFLKHQQGNQLKEKSVLDLLRLPVE